MRKIYFTIYKIDEHPDKAKCFVWVRNNYHYLAEHEVEDLVSSLNALQKEIGGKLDWSLGQVPDRGEYIRLTDYDKEALAELDMEACSLTGTFCDHDVIECVRTGDMGELINRLHKWCEYHYSDEGIEETAEANEWEFTHEGRRWIGPESN